ncbi:hypothetical protein [Infirmifilum sp. NZ]|uniref:hypothetical protein n=1 Tax=Infirmifilum sp. NZ TaxID=2926850 RepID=UPI0027A2912C|nr:hypothetical protein [Infirmifilum sp. NZ]UNQ73610.1 hypothetical protein MOV14_01005 [Infirmifilum sp. NZ]
MRLRGAEAKAPPHSPSKLAGRSEGAEPMSTPKRGPRISEGVDEPGAAISAEMIHSALLEWGLFAR